MAVQTVVIAALAILFIAILLARPARIFLKFRGRRVISCPDNHQAAGVIVDARHAALSALGHSPELRLSTCSRWPEKQGCGAPCLSQIAASPEDCLVRNLLVKWYEGKDCALCGQPFGGVDWAAAKPAVLNAAGVSLEWQEIPSEELFRTIETAKPVCFACHTANRMAREHPELVVDRTARYRTP
jgi:hypothetical protein